MPPTVLPVTIHENDTHGVVRLFLRRVRAGRNFGALFQQAFDRRRRLGYAEAWAPDEVFVLVGNEALRRDADTESGDAVDRFFEEGCEMVEQSIQAGRRLVPIHFFLERGKRAPSGFIAGQ